MDNQKIGVFDSGVGGLTTLKYLEEMLPEENFIFYADTKNAPYGSKDQVTLRKVLKEVIAFFVEKNVKIIVIACNTAGTQIDYLRTLTMIPLVEPITPTIAKINSIVINQDDYILLLATDYTVNSQVYQQALLHCNLIAQGAPLLVTMAENKDYSIDKVRDILPINDNISHVVLGCTHFGYFRDAINAILHPKAIIESSYELAVFVKKYLINKQLLANTNKEITEYYHS